MYTVYKDGEVLITKALYVVKKSYVNIRTHKGSSDGKTTAADQFI